MGRAQTAFTDVRGDDKAAGGLYRDVSIRSPFEFTDDGVFEHYVTPAPARWEPTDNGAGTWDWGVVLNGTNGEAALDSGASGAGTGMNVQQTKTTASLGYLAEPKRAIICESSILSSNLTATTPNAWFFGLSELNTQLIDAAGLLIATDNFAGFFYPGTRTAAADLGRPDFVYGGDTGGAVTVGTLEGNSRVMSSNVYMPMGIRVENNAIEWYMDNKLVASVAMAVPFGQVATTDQLFVTLEAVQLQTGQQMRMDYYTIQQRRRALT